MPALIPMQSSTEQVSVAAAQGQTVELHLRRVTKGEELGSLERVDEKMFLITSKINEVMQPVPLAA